MKAVRIHEYGGSKEIKFEDAPIPVISEDEILIKTEAAAFNPVDMLLGEGVFKNFMPLEFPYTLGLDVSGTVEKAGSMVKDIKPGDKVIAFLEYAKGGAMAEYVKVKAEYAVQAPRAVELKRAASIPLVALTAWQGLFQHAGLKSAQRVLITAASGGVGSYSVQFAKWKGAYVIGTASDRSIADLKEYGADETINYKEKDVTASISEPVDVVFNLAPLDNAGVSSLLSVIKPGGVLVSALNPADEDAAREKGIRTIRMHVGINSVQLKEIVSLIDDGKIHVYTSEILPMSSIVSVHERTAAGQTRGKIVLTV